MDIKQQTITVRDLVAGYMNDPDHGVRARHPHALHGTALGILCGHGTEI